MISQQSSERTARTDRRGTVRRGLKRRGILPSFGDIVLPFVSVAAVGLLILAGRQFFLNGIRTSPGITSTRAYADSPALIAERERAQELLNPQAAEEASPEIAAKPAPAKVVAAEPEMIPVIPEPAPKKPAPAPAKKSAPVVKKPDPAKKPAPAPKKPEPPQKPEPAPKPAQPARLPASKQWRIQVGAYPTKAGAQAEAAKIKKAGYRAEVYANPASKHVKVWVEGGADKASASQVVKAMQALGYKGSFAFPPAK